MALRIIKETIELDSITTDLSGNAFVQKRINLREGKMSALLQTDLFQDFFPYFELGAGGVLCEIVVSPYPAIPTDMDLQASPTAAKNRYQAAGTDSVLFKANGKMSDGELTDFKQFPSLQIAANQFTDFYTDHLYINIHFVALPETEIKNIAFSFLFTINSRTVNSLTHGIGILAESHDAMCALVMSNGHMISKTTLRGNVFPMWRYGGIRPEHTITPTAANAYFLPINTRDAETMTSTPGIRQAVRDARQMSAFDAAFGDKRPDWLKMHLNAGVVAGPLREQWPPIKHADNGNVLCL